MLDYDREAPTYDDTRGGACRATAAAAELERLLPVGGTVLDVGGGTGIVTSVLAARGRRVLVADRSVGMLRLAGRRLPGRVLAGDATALPVRTASVRGIVIVWLLHLMPSAVDSVFAECARVLEPAGVLVCTVDKDASGRGESPDPSACDAVATVTATAARFGLAHCADGAFVGGSARPPPTYPVRAFRREG
ncbi:MAG: SAM-dependent methyltransferase [Pseudonocardiales bacterium]|nr:MAG: SAM-dependent methyltransferase [Pseudonocardiales bacterium]